MKVAWNQRVEWRACRDIRCGTPSTFEGITPLVGIAPVRQSKRAQTKRPATAIRRLRSISLHLRGAMASPAGTWLGDIVNGSLMARGFSRGLGLEL